MTRNNTIRTLFAVLALLAVAGGIANAQQAPMVNRGMMGQGMAGTGGTGGNMMMSDVPLDVQRKMIEQQIKFQKDNATLMTNIRVGRMELHELWLDSMPNTDKIIAKMRDLDKLEMQLKENRVSNMVAMYNLLPPDLKKGAMMRFRRMMMGQGMMGQGMMMGRGMMMGQGMTCPMMGGMGMSSGMMGMDDPMGSDSEEQMSGD